MIRVHKLRGHYKGNEYTVEKLSSPWTRGQKARIARLAQVSPGNLGDILHRKRHATPVKARRLAAASARVLGPKNKIPWTEWLESESSTNKYFVGRPLKVRE